MNNKIKIQSGTEQMMSKKNNKSIQAAMVMKTFINSLSITQLQRFGKKRLSKLSKDICKILDVDKLEKPDNINEIESPRLWRVTLHSINGSFILISIHKQELLTREKDFLVRNKLGWSEGITHTDSGVYIFEKR